MLEAERRLGVDRRYLRGLIQGLRIPTRDVGSAIVISADDLDRLRPEVQQIRRPRRRRPIADASA